jgi:hypothetical protein
VANRGQRFVFGIAVVLCGLLMFLVASAYMVFRGYPHWLAAGVGALAFPVGPLSWHFLGERSRKKKAAAAKAPAKETLTAGDRYWLRCAAVALIVIGPMIAIGRFDVARATWRHGLWWFPTSYEPTTTHGGPLSTIGSGTPRTVDVFGTTLQRVPSDAELIVMIKPPPEPGQPTLDAVLAYGDKQVMAMARGDGLAITGKDLPETIAEMNKTRDKIPWLPLEPVELVTHSDTEVLIASAAWKSRVSLPGVGPSAELLHELGRAPKDAYVVAAFTPKTTRDALSTKAGAAWVYKKGEKLVIEGRLEANDEAAAKQLVAAATAALDKAVHDVPQKCREQVGAVVKAIQLDQTGAIVTGRLEIDGGAIIGVGFCAFKR